MKKVILAVMASAAFVSTQAVADPGQEKYGLCASCHGAAGEGVVGPKLSGQSKKDLIAKITKYKNGEQVGPMTSMMAPIAAGLSEADIKNVATYISTKL